MSERTRRVDHLLQEEISDIIAREVDDPRIGFVTITSVEVTPDLRHATVWASVIGDSATRAASIAALGRAMPFVRHRLGRLHLKRIPELHLREDDRAQAATRVMRLIDELDAEGGGPDGAGAGPDREEELPTPTARSSPVDPAEPPLPAGYRRRADRAAIRKARHKRGR